MRSHVAERDRRPSVCLRPSLGRRIVVGVAVTHCQGSLPFSPGAALDPQGDEDLNKVVTACLAVNFGA